MVYLEAVIQEFSLKHLFYFIYTWGIPVVGSISSRAAGTISAILVRLGSFVGVSQVFYLFIVWTAVFCGIALSGWFIILYTLFILPYMKGKHCGERSSRVDF